MVNCINQQYLPCTCQNCLLLVEWNKANHSALKFSFLNIYILKSKPVQDNVGPITHLLNTPSTPETPIPSTMSRVSLNGIVSGVTNVRPCSNAIPTTIKLWIKL